MKKFFLFLSLTFSSALFLNAQDCSGFFPTDEGTVMISSNYDANKSLLSTMTYRVGKTYNNALGNSSTIAYVLKDASGKVMDDGNIDASCQDGVFYMKMNNMGMLPEMMGTITDQTELIGDFLDYPNTFADEPFNQTFAMTGGEFTIRSKADKKADTRVRVYNRHYEGNEKVTTPAGTFDASKISFDFEVTKNNKTMTYKGTEWYGMNAGIIKTETYDTKNNLLSYTELSTLTMAK